MAANWFRSQGWNLRDEQSREAVILLLSTVLMVTWYYFASPTYLATHLPAVAWLGGDARATGAVGSQVAAFVLLGLIPLLVVKFVFRERLADYGVQLGDRMKTFRATAVWVPIFVISSYFSADDASLRAHYPLNPTAGVSLEAFAIHAAGYFLFYLGWEFHFRGFLQFGLRQGTGPVNAVLIQVLASCLLHLGKPTVETYMSILGGILWGWLAFRTKSLLSGLLQHSCLGISLDWFICHRP